MLLPTNVVKFHIGHFCLLVVLVTALLGNESIDTP